MPGGIITRISLLLFRFGKLSAIYTLTMPEVRLFLRGRGTVEMLSGTAGVFNYSCHHHTGPLNMVIEYHHG